jgi:two-component system, LytTR family, response regulator
MISCIIIDDQEEAINVLKIHIKAKDNIDLKATFSNPVDALNFLEKNEIDLVFVDIEMPIMNGLELIETIQAKRDIKLPKFILTTGYDAYALKSYQYGVIDYLMKPVTFKLLTAAVDKYLDIAPSDAGLSNTVENSFFFADVEGKKTRIDTTDIIYIESGGNYVSLFKSDKRLLIYKSMGDLETLLPKQQFCRVHKSYIVAIAKIDVVSQLELEISYQGNKIIIPVGRTYREALKKRLHLD